MYNGCNGDDLRNSYPKGKYNIMKKILSIIFVLAMIATLALPCAAADIENGTGNGDWEVKGEDSVLCTWGEGLLAGSGGYYQLGLADSFELTMSLGANWRAGIIFGVNDVNEDGYIEQDEDQYILVCFRDSQTYSDDGMTITDVGLSINDCDWCGWVTDKEPNDKENNPIGFFEEGLKVKIKYSEGTLEVYAAGGHNPDSGFERGEDEWELFLKKEGLTPAGRGFGLWCKTSEDNNYPEYLFDNVSFTADGVAGKIPVKEESPTTPGDDVPPVTTTNEGSDDQNPTTDPDTTKGPDTTKAPDTTKGDGNKADTSEPDSDGLSPILIVCIIAGAVAVVAVVVVVVIKKK